jgi:ABC-type transport system involved in cytochrome c biogenesis permease subunit
MKYLGQFFPWMVVLLGGVYFLIAALPPFERDDEMHIHKFGQVPVLEEGTTESAGRIKPLSSVARNDLMAISGQADFTDENGKTQPAITWLLDVMSSQILIQQADAQNELIRNQPIEINNAHLREMIGFLKDGPVVFGDFDRAKLLKLLEEVKRIEAMPDDKRSDFDNAVMAVFHQLEFAARQMKKGEANRTPLTYKVFKIDNDQVVDLFGLKRRSGFRYSIDECSGKMDAFMERVRKIMDSEGKELDLYDTKVMETYRRFVLFQRLASLESPWDVPPMEKQKTWQPLGAALKEEDLSGHGNPLASSLEKILIAYASNDVKTFNSELAVYHERLRDLYPEESKKADFESLINHFDPFMHCMVFYGLVFLLACISWVAWPGPLHRAAFWLAALTLVVHTATLISRMYLQDRYFVFVTNLYSSAIFIGWGCVLLGLIIDAIFKNGIGIVAASVLGFCSLFVARYLASTSNGETMEMLQAVLDTNFWLATHVSCVTFGYMATFFAGFLGIVYLVLGVFTRLLNRDLIKILGQMIYGVVCFATLLSFTGTVLGGIWADQSWGRFWGWDPKENGAVLIVIWNALILHARWAGLVKQRGMALLTIVGNMITGWSWFGTNQLGVGLHAYGFNNELAVGLVIFWFSQLLMLGIGLAPQRYWRSFDSMNQKSVANRGATSGPKPASPAVARR